MVSKLNKLILVGLVSALSISGFAATKKVRRSKKKVKSVKVLKKSPWSFGLYTESYRNAAESDKSFDTYNMISVNYKLNKKSSFSVITPFTFNWDNVDPQMADMAAQLQYTHKKLGRNINFKSRYRLYIPTSQGAQELGRYQLRARYTLSGDVNKTWTYMLRTNPRFYGYSNDDSGQLGLKWMNLAGLTAKINDSFSVTGQVGYVHYNRNEGPVYKPDTSFYLLEDPYDFDDSLYLYLEMAVSLNKNITLIPYIEQERNLRTSDSTSLFKDVETTYYLGLDVSL